MEAIIEVVAAFVTAIIMAAFAFMEIVLTLLFGLLEGLFVLATQGAPEAKAHWSDSKQNAGNKWKQRRDHGDNSGAASEMLSGADDAHLRAEESTRTLIGCGLMLILLIAVSWIFVMTLRINKRRTDEAQQIVSNRVEAIRGTWGDPPPHVDPDEGPLNVRDPWGNRLELFVDEALLGVMLTVRSAGNDDETGTIDDVLSVRFKPAKAGDLGRELGDRAARRAQSKFEDLKARFGVKADEMRQRFSDVTQGKEDNTGSPALPNNTTGPVDSMPPADED